jgi:hypothetical protein
VLHTAALQLQQLLIIDQQYISIVLISIFIGLKIFIFFYCYKIFISPFICTNYLKKKFSMDFIVKSIKKPIKSCDCNHECNAKWFKQNFKNWTSGNSQIDKFIQNTQLSDHNCQYQALEWIPYNRFYDIRYISKGEFNKMYRANWIDGRIIELCFQSSWDDDNQNWKRENPNMFIILKILNNPTSITSEFINKV